MSTPATRSVPGDLVPAPWRLHDVAAAWIRAGRPAQPGIRWPRDAWVGSFPEHRSVFEQLPDRCGRAEVRRVAANATDGDEAATGAFIASMVWGYGNVGYGRWRTRRVLERNADSAAILRQAAQVAADAGALAAYQWMANDGRLRFLGPAFGTKFLHFVPQATTGPTALIYDAIVARAIAASCGVRMSPTTWRTRTYDRYLRLVNRWATELGEDPVDVEMLLFVSLAPGQWAVDWLPQPAAGHI